MVKASYNLLWIVAEIFFILIIKVFFSPRLSVFCGQIDNQLALICEKKKYNEKMEDHDGKSMENRW